MLIAPRSEKTRVAAASLIAAGALSFLTGFGSPSAATPSSFLELDGNVRSDTSLDWGTSGGPAGTNGAFSGGVFVGATTPPTPPTATPALTGADGFVSGAFSVDPLAVDANPCAPGGGTGDGDPTVFTGAGGEKNGDRIDTMTFSTGSVPDKDDLSNVYAVAHTPAAGAAEVFFGAERVVNNGDSHLDFELLHAAVSRSAGCSGSFAGNRSQGDLLVAVDFTAGGALAGRTVRQWHCAEEGDPQPPDGTPCDPPATGPSIPHYEDVTAVAAIAAAVRVEVNTLAAAPCGGWACRAADGSQVPSLPTNAFVEGGVDLGAVGFGGCGATLFPHSRTSQSFQSTLKDFTGPLSLDLCATPRVATTATPTGGGVPAGTPASDTATVINGGSPVTTGTVTFFLCQPSEATAAGCPARAGAQIGSPQGLDGSGRASPGVHALVTSTIGTYCWRAEYAPAQGSGLHPATHTNGGSECFTTVGEATTTTTVAPTPTTTTTSTTTTVAPTTTTTPGGVEISAITVERVTTTTIAPQVLGVVLAAPAEQVVATRLARTGATIAPLLVWAGLAMMIGGCLALGARPRSRPARRGR